MLHEEAAYEVMVIPESVFRLCVTRQEDTGVLDGGASEDKAFSLYRVFLPGEVRDGDGSDGRHRFISGDVYEVSIRIEMDVLRSHDLRAVFFAQACWRAELPDLVPYRRVAGQEGSQLRVLFLPPGDVVFAGAQVDDRLRPGIVGIEVAAVDGPATMGNPVPFFEVQGIIGRAVAGLVVAGATEIMQPCRFQRVIFLAGALAGIEVLDLVVVIEAAAFQEDDFIGCLVPLEGDAETRGTCTDDADISFYQGVFGQLSGVYVHEVNWNLVRKERIDALRCGRVPSL